MSPAEIQAIQLTRSQISELTQQDFALIKTEAERLYLQLEKYQRHASCVNFVRCSTADTLWFFAAFSAMLIEQLLARKSCEPWLPQMYPVPTPSFMLGVSALGQLLLEMGGRTRESQLWGKTDSTGIWHEPCTKGVMPDVASHIRRLKMIVEDIGTALGELPLGHPGRTGFIWNSDGRLRMIAVDNNAASLATHDNKEVGRDGRGMKAASLSTATKPLFKAAETQPDGGGVETRALHSQTLTSTILYLGDKAYSIGESSPITVTDSEHAILQEFIRVLSMDTESLQTKSGNERAPRILGKLAKKYSGAFGPAIRLPGGKGKGGYHVSIQDARPHLNSALNAHLLHLQINSFRADN